VHAGSGLAGEVSLELVGRQSSDPRVVPCHAVELIGARLGDGDDRAARRAPVLGAVWAVTIFTSAVLCAEGIRATWE
jgi:hypothetical protein